METATKLTNLQQELLKVFSRDIPEKELEEIRDLLADYFYKKTVEQADKVWNEKGYTNELMDKWLNDPNQ